MLSSVERDKSFINSDPNQSELTRICRGLWRASSIGDQCLVKQYAGSTCIEWAAAWVYQGSIVTATVGSRRVRVGIRGTHKKRVWTLRHCIGLKSWCEINVFELMLYVPVIIFLSCRNVFLVLTSTMRRRTIYSKTCLKQPLKKKTKTCFSRPIIAKCRFCNTFELH